MLTPIVIQQTMKGERAYDIFSRLLEDRIVWVSDHIEAYNAPTVVAQLLFLASQSDEDIQLYVNSPGGVVNEGNAILDCMDWIKCDVSTICIGQAASMGSLILSNGTRGKRFVLPRSLVMLHQPSGAMAYGKASDIERSFNQLMDTKMELAKTLAKNCNHPLEKIIIDFDRDFFMNAQEAVDYGIVDAILTQSP